MTNAHSHRQRRREKTVEFVASCANRRALDGCDLYFILIFGRFRAFTYTTLDRLPADFFTARRNARIASAVLATAIPSVRLSVCLSVSHTPILCQNDCM